MSGDVCSLTIAELGAAYRAGTLSPVEVVNAALERIERLNPKLNAYITVLADHALAKAREAETELRAGQDRGPLHGVPISLKDLIATQGIRTTAGSNVLADWVPDADATVTRKLDAAGAVLLGKANLHEFAYGPTSHISAFGPTRNPWDTERITGGSSGGSAAGVAARIEFGSLGTDTGGSVRMPASYCGIVGLKPTFGLVSRTGVVPLSWSMDTVGPMTRTVHDNALLLQAIAGYDPTDPGSAQVQGNQVQGERRKEKGDEDSGLLSPISFDLSPRVRIGVPRDYFWDGLEPAVEGAVRRALETLGELGATLVEVSLPHAADAIAAGQLIMGSEAYCYHEPWLRSRPDDYQPGLRQRIESSVGVLAVDYIRGHRVRELLRQEVRAAFDGIDLLATPTMPCVAPLLSEATERAHTRFTTIFNMVGSPAISVPCGFSAEATGRGLPIGLQLVGRPFDEATIYQVAYAYEQATEWHKQIPILGDS